MISPYTHENELWNAIANKDIDAIRNIMADDARTIVFGNTITKEYACEFIENNNFKHYTLDNMEVICNIESIDQVSYSVSVSIKGINGVYTYRKLSIISIWSTEKDKRRLKLFVVNYNY